MYDDAGESFAITTMTSTQEVNRKHHVQIKSQIIRMLIRMSGCLCVCEPISVSTAWSQLQMSWAETTTTPTTIVSLARRSNVWGAWLEGFSGLSNLRIYVPFGGECMCNIFQVVNILFTLSLADSHGPAEMYLVGVFVRKNRTLPFPRPP